MTHDETDDGVEPAGGLLQAVLNDPQLRRRLGEMPPDEKTIALSADGTDRFAHPDWKSESNQPDDAETIEIPPELLHEFIPNHNDAGFVPKRSVSMLGEGRQDEVDYRLIGRLGSGGTGVVYQAHQRAIDREVALKVLRNELAQNQISRDRFLTEARVIGGLDHPNVIALHEVCVDEAGGLFYSMKRIDGTSWDQRIAEMSESENVNTLLRVADAIRYAHSRGLIHRDIKPENIMLGKFGEVLLADWGLAISHSEAESSEEVHHSIGGTPAYMAPELATSGHITYQTDVYLLGAILFQVLTGHPPHSGTSLLACIRAAARNEIRETDVEGELMDIAVKAMATHPEDRYESVEAMIDALEHQRQHDQSGRLVRRACKRMTAATADNHYEDFRIADALLSEAIEVWPENERALLARTKLQEKFAESAASRGDLDLALSIYEAAGLGESDAAADVRVKRDKRDSGHRQASKYSALFTQSPEAGLLIQMTTGIVVEANRMYEQLFGYDAKEVAGRKISELNLWACPERRNLMIQELQETGAIDNFEARFLHTDGHAIDVLISGRVVDVRGEDMLVSTIRDISQRKKAETELHQSRQRLRDLQSLAGLATWSYDVRTESVSWSEEAFLLADRDPEQGPPTPEEFMELIHPEDRPKLKTTIDNALSSGAAYEVRVRQKGARGNYKSLLVRGQPIFDAEGKTIEIYGVLMPERAAR